MILKRKLLSLSEVKEHLDGIEDRKSIHEYLTKFAKLSGKDAIKLTGELKDLNNPKIKEENIIKVADLMPQDSEDLSKIFNEVTLTEEESNAVLEIVKKY